MKTTLLFLFVSFSISIAIPGYSQIYDSGDYTGVISQLYFDRQPNPKSEAMGKGLVANSDGEFGSYYNPALTALGEGVNFNISHTFLDRKNVDYNYIGGGYSDKKIGGFSISKYSWGKGATPSSPENYHNAIHTLNYSRELGDGFYGGINLELVHLGYLSNSYYNSSYDQRSSDAVTVDVGFLKKIDLNKSESKNTVKIMQIGAAIYNLTGESIVNRSYEYSSLSLPVIFRLGASYNFKILESEGNLKSSPFQSFTHIEVETILNSKSSRAFKIGQEIIVSDFFILRGGMVSSRNTNFSYSDYREENSSDFTYGIGFKLGFNKFLKAQDPLTVILDYSGTPLTAYYNDFSIVSLKVNYIP